MNLRLLPLPLLILSLDLVPGVPARDSTGAMCRVSFGLGTGVYEHKHFDCQGNLVGTNAVRLSSGGARAEFMGDHARLAVCAGQISSDAAKSEAENYGGTYAGLQAAYEWRRVGVGLGAAQVGGASGFIAPSAYLRIGRLDQMHFRCDVFPPSETFGNGPWARVGIGRNLGFAPGWRGYWGLGIMPYTYGEQLEPRFVQEYAFPLAGRAEFLLRNQIGPGADRMQWGASAGIGFRLDSRAGGR